MQKSCTMAHVENPSPLLTLVQSIHAVAQLPESRPWCIPQQFKGSDGVTRNLLPLTTKMGHSNATNQMSQKLTLRYGGCCYRRIADLLSDAGWQIHSEPLPAGAGSIILRNVIPDTA
jgi:hypothetical protein